MKRKSLLCIVAFVFCILACSFISSGRVKADLIIRPTFSPTPPRSVTLLKREYTVNSPTGAVASYKYPSSRDTVKAYLNGEEIYLYWLYTDPNGVQWGGKVGGTEPEQWFRLDYLTVIYDNVSFWEEHEDEISRYQGGFDSALSNNFVTKTFNMYTYPNSDRYFSMSANLSAITLSYIYVDSDGNVWGYVGYLYGRHGWIKLKDIIKITTVFKSADVEIVIPNFTDKPFYTTIPTYKPTQTPTVIPSVSNWPTPKPTVIYPTIKPTWIALDKLYDKFALDYKILDQFEDVYRARITIMNNSKSVVEGWKLDFTLKNKLLSIYDADVNESDKEFYSITNGTENSVIKPGGEVSFTIEAQGEPECKPEDFKLYYAKYEK